MNVSALLDKVENFEQLQQKEQVKLMSFFFCVESEIETFVPSQIADCFVCHNLKVPANISREFSMLTASRPAVFIKKQQGYGFERNAKRELEKIYLGTVHQQNISSTLRGLLVKVASKEQQSFLEEAISCFEIKSYRASVIMSWLLTMDVLYETVIKSHLIDFNNAIQTHGKYKKIVVKTKDDFSDIKESDFIELLRVAKLIPNDTRKILSEKLDFRNTCAHPNSVTIKESKAIAFIEDLVENVIIKFQL